MVTLRQYQHPQDYAAVYQLWKTAGKGIHIARSDTLEEIEKKIQRDPDLFLLAVDDDRVIGSLIGGFDGRRGLLYHLAVAQDYRRLGIGYRLIDAVEKRLRQKGCLKVYLLVANDYQYAYDYYRSQGWEPMEVHLLGKEIQ